MLNIDIQLGETFLAGENTACSFMGVGERILACCITKLTYKCLIVYSKSAII